MPLDMNTLDAFIPTVNSVLYQHASELPFLQALRCMAIREPNYSLADLARLDHRVEAHIDGLRVAGEEGWQLARKELAWKEPGEAFADFSAGYLQIGKAGCRRIERGMDAPGGAVIAGAGNAGSVDDAKPRGRQLVPCCRSLRQQGSRNLPQPVRRSSEPTPERDVR